MKHWTNRRKASLVIHAIVVLIPLVFGTVSALLFWQRLFDSWLVAVPMVAVIDVLALLGLVLFICRIESPFVWLRHALPFVSIVPLGAELWQLLTPHNDIWVTGIVTVLATAVMVGVAWRCYVTIERLFVDPVTAATELLHEQAAFAQQQMTLQVRGFATALTSMIEQQQIAVSAIEEWSQRPQMILQSTVPALPAVDSGVTLQATRRQVRAYANREGVSERTIYRRLEAGDLTHADILGKER